MSDPKQYYSVDTLVEESCSEEVKRRYFELKLEDEKRLADELTTLRSQAETLDRELHQQIQWKLEAFGLSEKFKAQVVELAAQVDMLTGERDKAIERLKEARELLESSRQALNDVAAHGTCDCDIPNDCLCIVCECSNMLEPIATWLKGTP